jgi:preprotein translocase subunit SecA
LIEYKKEAFNAFSALNFTINSDCIEKYLKVQIVSQDQAEQMEEMLQGPDLDELDYAGADESNAGGAIQAPAARPAAPEAEEDDGALKAPQKMRMRAGPPQPTDDRQMNREERRRIEKAKKR